MFSHVTLGVSDFDAAFRFYGPLLAMLGLELKFREDERAWAGWKAQGADRPLFIVGRPFDGEPPTPGNGAMTALLAPDRETVQRVYQAAIEAGGCSEGVPGLRPEYHPNYFGAYFRDLDGNKLCVCCHD